MFTKEEVSRVYAFIWDRESLIIVYSGRRVTIKDSCLINCELFMNRRQHFLNIVNPFDLSLFDTFFLWWGVRGAIGECSD